MKNLLLLLIIIFGISQYSSAIDITWSGGGDGTDFNQGANWIGGVVPGSGDGVIFDGSTATITTTGSNPVSLGGNVQIINGADITSNIGFTATSFNLVLNNGTAVFNTTASSFINITFTGGTNNLTFNIAPTVGRDMNVQNSGTTANFTTTVAVVLNRDLETFAGTFNNTSGSSLTANRHISISSGATLCNDGSMFYGSTFTCNGTCKGNTPLSLSAPVEFVYFKGKVEKNRVILDWQTASEVNNEVFDLEHSIDGQTWRRLSSINGQGTSFELQNYTFLHNNPSKGYNYYRLKQIDFDGAFKYSDVVSIELLEPDGQFGLQVKPNPVQNGFMTINLPEIEAESISMEIFSYAGIKVQEHNLTEKEVIINVSDLFPGIYLVQLQIGGKVFLERILVQ